MTRREGRRLPQVDPAQFSAEQPTAYERIAGTRGRVAGPFTKP